MLLETIRSLLPSEFELHWKELVENSPIVIKIKTTDRSEIQYTENKWRTILQTIAESEAQEREDLTQINIRDKEYTLTVNIYSTATVMIQGGKNKGKWLLHNLAKMNEMLEAYDGVNKAPTTCTKDGSCPKHVTADTEGCCELGAVNAPSVPHTDKLEVSSSQEKHSSQSNNSNLPVKKQKVALPRRLCNIEYRLQGESEYSKGFTMREQHKPNSVWRSWVNLENEEGIENSINFEEVAIWREVPKIINSNSSTETARQEKNTKSISAETKDKNLSVISNLAQKLQTQAEEVTVSHLVDKITDKMSKLSTQNGDNPRKPPTENPKEPQALVRSIEEALTELEKLEPQENGVNSTCDDSINTSQTWNRHDSYRSTILDSSTDEENTYMSKDDFNDSIRELYYTPVALSPQVAQIFDFLPPGNNLLINPAKLVLQTQSTEIEMKPQTHTRTRSVANYMNCNRSTDKKRERSNTYPMCTHSNSSPLEIFKLEKEQRQQQDDVFENEWKHHCNLSKEHSSNLWETNLNTFKAKPLALRSMSQNKGLRKKKTRGITAAPTKAPNKNRNPTGQQPRNASKVKTIKNKAAENHTVSSALLHNKLKIVENTIQNTGENSITPASLFENKVKRLENINQRRLKQIKQLKKEIASEKGKRAAMKSIIKCYQDTEGKHNKESEEMQEKLTKLTSIVMSLNKSEPNMLEVSGKDEAQAENLSYTGSVKLTYLQDIVSSEIMRAQEADKSVSAESESNTELTTLHYASEESEINTELTTLHYASEKLGTSDQHLSEVASNLRSGSKYAYETDTAMKIQVTGESNSPAEIGTALDENISDSDAGSTDKSVTSEDESTLESECESVKSVSPEPETDTPQELLIPPAGKTVYAPETVTAPDQHQSKVESSLLSDTMNVGDKSNNRTSNDVTRKSK